MTPYQEVESRRKLASQLLVSAPTASRLAHGLPGQSAIKNVLTPTMLRWVVAGEIEPVRESAVTTTRISISKVVMWRGVRKMVDGSSGSAGHPALEPVEREEEGEEDSVRGRGLGGGSARVEIGRLRLVTMAIVQVNNN